MIEALLLGLLLGYAARIVVESMRCARPRSHVTFRARALVVALKGDERP